MHSTDGATKSDGYAARWKRVMQTMKMATSKIGGADAQRSAWVLWANEVVNDLGHLTRKPMLLPPEEEQDWLKLRRLAEKRRRIGRRMGARERALLIDVGDFLLQVRSVESENASLLECLLHAARVIWDANARRPNKTVVAIYDHIAEGWGVMPPPVEELPSNRRRCLQLCAKLVREEDVVPSWYMHGAPIPRELLEEKEKPAEVEEADPPEVGDLFDGV